MARQRTRAQVYEQQKLTGQCAATRGDGRVAGQVIAGFEAQCATLYPHLAQLVEQFHSRCEPVIIEVAPEPFPDGGMVLAKTSLCRETLSGAFNAGRAPQY